MGLRLIRGIKYLLIVILIFAVLIQVVNYVVFDRQVKIDESVSPEGEYRLVLSELGRVPVYGGMRRTLTLYGRRKIFSQSIVVEKSDDWEVHWSKDKVIADFPEEGRTRRHTITFDGTYSQEVF